MTDSVSEATSESRKFESQSDSAKRGPRSNQPSGSESPTTSESPPGDDFGRLLFWNQEGGRRTGASESVGYVSDFNLDQVVSALVADREEPEFLAALFYANLHDTDDVRFRQEIFQDLRSALVLHAMTEFALQMRQVRRRLEQIPKLHYRYHIEGWLLDSVAIYCQAVAELASKMAETEVHSRGLTSFKDYLSQYVASEQFKSLTSETDDRQSELAALKYTVRIHAGRVDVRRYDTETDYSVEVLNTFDRFKQGAVKNYLVKYRGWPGMDHVGAQILDRVARLFSVEFASLDDFSRRHRDFFDANVRRFERELQFFLAYQSYIAPLESSGHSFCLPEVTDESKEIFATDTFDIALAKKLLAEGTPLVVNEFLLQGKERSFVVSGPNQGGKTTFARTFGQLHHLASIGCPVPGSAARLFLFDHLFTHFEREEDLTNMRGKLEDDLVRIYDVLERATSNSIIIMNEIFTSTSLSDARFLGTKVMERVIALDLLCIYVTFVDEIATLADSVVSMVSTIVPENPAERTYRVVRGPANGLAYAQALAEKYRVTYQQLKGRITQ